jgi:hypothetical protein
VSTALAKRVCRIVMCGLSDSAILFTHYLKNGIATGYGLGNPGIESRWGRDFPDRAWGPPSLLYNGYWVFPGGRKRSGRDADPSPLIVPRSKNRVALYLYSPEGPSWPVKRVKPTNLLNGAIFVTRLLNFKRVCWFSFYREFSKTSVNLVRFVWNEFSRQISKSQVSNFIKLRQVGAGLFHADGETRLKLTVAHRNVAKVPKK